MNVRDRILDQGRRTAREAAKLMGIEYSTLANWLSGTTDAGPKVTSNVAKFLKIDESEVPKKLPKKNVRDHPSAAISNEAAESRSKDDYVPPVEIQEYKTALEFVLGNLTEAQRDALHTQLRKMKSLPVDRQLKLGVRQLISTALLKVEDALERQSIPKN